MIIIFTNKLITAVFIYTLIYRCMTYIRIVGYRFMLLSETMRAILKCLCFLINLRDIMYVTNDNYQLNCYPNCAHYLYLE